MPTSDWCTCQVASDGALPGLRNVITRARRYCALATAPNRSGVGPTASARKGAMRGPAANRATPASSATSTAIERFGSEKIQAHKGGNKAVEGREPYRKGRDGP